ncbi:MAG TPA: RNA polymerase sigma factor, partial [Acidobacteriota bacterium]|nr:RNA polymerase sigma factor [Acidobacteriota bacterium]
MISDDVNVDGGLNDKRDEKDLENLLAGDSRAVWRIWRRYERDLGKICVRYLKSPADAEGAMGDLMLRIVDKLPHNAAKISNLRAWLKRLAVNLCLDRLRRRQGFRPLERDMRIESRTPERDLLTGESEEVIERLLGEISQSLREAFVLRFQRDLSYAEIADRLQISRAAARKRIERAREQLRAKLEASPRSGSEEPAAASPLRVGQASEIRRAPSVLRPV